MHDPANGLRRTHLFLGTWVNRIKTGVTALIVRWTPEPQGRQRRRIDHSPRRRPRVSRRCDMRLGMTSPGRGSRVSPPLPSRQHLPVARGCVGQTASYGRVRGVRPGSALDHVGPDHVADVPVRTWAPVVPIVLDTRLQGDHVATRRRSHREVSYWNLEDVAYRVGVGGAIRVG
jgi:hypothetical protein